MTGDSTTTSRSGAEQRLPQQHPIKTDEIEILESAGGDTDTQPDKVSKCFRHNVDNNKTENQIDWKAFPFEFQLEYIFLSIFLLFFSV